MDQVWQYLLNHLDTILAVLGGGSFLMYKERKRQAENAAKEGEFKNITDRQDFIERKLKEKDYEAQRRDRQIYGLQKAFGIVTSQKYSAERLICKRLPCTDREPELGSYHTHDPKLEEGENENKSERN